MIFKPKFDAEGVLSEYPRPQKRRKSYFTLNGEWDYKFSLKESFETCFDGKIIVPYCPESDLSGVKRQLKADEVLHLKKTFALPEGFNKGRVFLYVGACDQTCKVYLNGEFLYENRDGYTAFTVELTNITDGQNVLYVTVKDNADSDVYGRGKQKYKRGGIWYTAISGIWKSCFLESTPDFYCKDFTFDIDYDNKLLTVSCELNYPEKSAYVSIIDENKEVSGGFSVNGKITFDVKNLKEWSPEHPELYVVKIVAGDDEIESYVGIRKFSKIKIKDKWYFAVNNKPVFFSGLLDQGYYYGGIYTPKSNLSMFDELSNLKKMGFNMLRKHIKVESALWYYYCDLLGIAVFQDMINGGKPYKFLRIILAPFLNLRLNDKNYKSMGRDNEESRNQYVYEAKRMMNELKNVTSLYLYTPFNEGWGQFDSVENYRRFSSEDGSRLFDHASGWQDNGEGDTLSKHIYFRKLKMKNDGKRVLFLSEFGGYSLYVKGHAFSDKKFGYKSFNGQKQFEKALKNLYLKEVLDMIKKQGLSGICYTQVSDVEDETNGLYTYDGILKINPAVMLELNEKLYKAFFETLNEQIEQITE